MYTESSRSIQTGVVGIWATIKSCIQLNDWTRQAVKTTRTLREESLDIRTRVGKIKTKKIEFSIK